MNSRRRNWRPPTPKLRFSPYAWAKLLFLRDAGRTEIGGFGITPPDDLLLVEDICLVQQFCSPISVRFDDVAVADFFDQQVDQGRHPSQFARIWVHTHPCHSPAPSEIDEETFVRCFGRSDWAVMFILACGGETYTRLRFNVGPGGELEIRNEVDFAQPFAAACQDQWAQEYDELVFAESASYSVLDDETWDVQMPGEDTGPDLVERANRELYLAEEDEEMEAWFDWRMQMDS
jgi:proteasome lid subunit RPN8/RPN11